MHCCRFAATTGVFFAAPSAMFVSGRNLDGSCPDESGDAFNLDQTTSDGIQCTTLAFSALVMMTGNLEAQSFFPPGKVADYTGFQYLRDNDPDGMGRNTSFLTRVACDVIYILDTDQLAALATSQQDSFEEYSWKRYPIMQAFRRLIDGEPPTGTTGLTEVAVVAESKALCRIDGQIRYDRAVLYVEIINGFSASQKSSLDARVDRTAVMPMRATTSAGMQDQSWRTSISAPSGRAPILDPST